MVTRNGPVRTKKVAAMGTGTYDLLTFMMKHLENTPGAEEDVRAAAEVAKVKCENIGLEYGKLWDEHGVSWSIALYGSFVQQQGSPPPVEAPPTKNPDPTPIPEGIRNSFERNQTVTPPEPPEPFVEAKPRMLHRSLARRYFLHNGDTSVQKAIGLWTKQDILNNIAAKQSVIDGRVYVLEAWLELASRLPNNDSIVCDFVTEEELDALRLRGLNE